jgi:curved DNA-binding protein CbpA
MAVLALVDLTAPDRRVPTRRDVQQAFRDGLRDVHPDHGGDDADAADRIAELAEARRILLSS